VDTQHDFMDPEGKLYVPGAEALVPALTALTDFAHARGIPILASSVDHVREWSARGVRRVRTADIVRGTALESRR
jgi:nicotinamidase-related amidase